MRIRTETSCKFKDTLRINCFQSARTQNYCNMLALLPNIDLHVFTTPLELVWDSDDFLHGVFCSSLSSIGLNLNSQWGEYFRHEGKFQFAEKKVPQIRTNLLSKFSKFIEVFVTLACWFDDGRPQLKRRWDVAFSMSRDFTSPDLTDCLARSPKNARKM